MRVTELFTKTQKETPSGEVSKNAQLLIRAGFIHKEMAGVYAYLPLGKRVLDKITKIVKEEMYAAGGQEISLTVLQSKELWMRSGRWDDKVVDDWFKTKLVDGSELGLGFSHEEPLTDLLRDYINSYQDLPKMIYQVQSKFRNELRAKSGLLRGREFLMKDMYSFARTEAEHQELFSRAKDAYVRVFNRLGIGDKTFFTVASGGSFSTDFSYEYQTVADSGEDTIHLDRDQGIAINDEILSDEVIKQLGLSKASLETIKTCEAGNIFNLGTKYSDSLGLTYADKDNKQNPVIMGCYGLGISRAMGLIVEVMSDDRGLIWPEAIAPAKVYLVRLGDSPEVAKKADELYKSLMDRDVEVLYDDRDVRPGEKLADADLIGLPYRVVVSEKTLAEEKVEVKQRTSTEVELLNPHKFVESISLKP